MCSGVRGKRLWSDAAFFGITLFLLAFSAGAQQVQWASKLIKFSSDLGGKQNGVKRILGKPDAFPQGGPSPNAWSPKNALDGFEWVTVGFDKPQPVKQIAVFENLNAGCVIRVQADEGDGKFKTVWSRENARQAFREAYAYTFQKDRRYYFGRKRRKIDKAPEVNVNPGVERIILASPLPNVVALKVEFSFALVPGQKQVDAIGISDSEAPLDGVIRTRPEFAGLKAETIPLPGMEPGNPCVSHDGTRLYLTDIGAHRDAVVSFTRTPDGKWDGKTAEAAFSGASTYNYLEFKGADFVLKGGIPFGKGTGETGYELFRLQDGRYISSGPVRVTAYNNYDDTSDATMTPDGTVLVMGIETDFTQGGTDLYFAPRKEDGSYGLLQNMGKILNSAADEGMPQLLSDGRTLLFSSNGFSSHGDFDLYVSTRLDDSWKNWSEPVNLGPAINGDDFDGQPFYDEVSQTLLYISAVDGQPALKQAAIPAGLLKKS